MLLRFVGSCGMEPEEELRFQFASLGKGLSQSNRGRDVCICKVLFSVWVFGMGKPQSNSGREKYICVESVSWLEFGMEKSQSNRGRDVCVCRASFCE